MARTKPLENKAFSFKGKRAREKTMAFPAIEPCSTDDWAYQLTLIQFPSAFMLIKMTNNEGHVPCLHLFLQ